MHPVLANSDVCAFVKGGEGVGGVAAAGIEGAGLRRHTICLVAAWMRKIGQSIVTNTLSKRLVYQSHSGSTSLKQYL